MNTLSLWILLSVPVLSVQTSAQTDSLLVKKEMEEKKEIIQEESEEETLQVRVKGFLDSYHAVRTEGKVEWMASRTRARGELTLEKGAASLFLSLNATYNGLLRDRTQLELREAYLSYAKNNMDLRVGRQIVVWGVADALRLTDCVSPFDYTEFLAQDYDDIRMPVNALRAKYTKQFLTIEAICIPVPDFFILPTNKNNPWAFKLPLTTLPYQIDLEKNKPEKRLKNLEFGGRVSANLSGIDFSVSALYTWNKMPALEPRLSTDKNSLQINGQYQRMTMLGGDCSLPLGQFVIRTEAAYNFNELQGASLGHNVEHRNTLNGLIGFDWYPGNEWYISAQYSHKYTVGSLYGLSSYHNTGLTTARISKELLHNTLKLSTFAYIDVTNGGVFNRLSAIHSLNDQIELSMGYDLFYADKGRFATYNHNSEVWMKIKYSF